MSILKHIATVACMLIATTAHADWDHTHWGQSLQSLLDMDEYEVVETPEDNDFRVDLMYDYGVDLRPFGFAAATARTTDRLEEFFVAGTINFLTVNDELSGVVIKMDDLDSLLPIILFERYGAPNRLPQAGKREECIGSRLFWRDEPSGNNVQLIYVDCEDQTSAIRLLIYTPILTAENSPL
jgi:hypothetical protein